MGPFHLESIAAGGDRAVLRIDGDIDACTAPQLRERVMDLAGTGTVHVIADLRGVGFLDSAGLGALVAARKELRGRAGSLMLVAGTGRIVQVLRITAIPPDKVALNAQYHQALTSINSKNVWQYYDLVDTQWPAEPSKKPLGNPIPAFLANSVLETFFQGPTVGPISSKNPPHGCINCHGTYGLDKDFVFQLNDAYPQSKKKKTVLFAH